MTQVPVNPAQGGVPASIGDYNFASTGLEDFSTSDAVLPRIKIDHETGTWVDNLGSFRATELHFIVLGLVKQRVLFHNIVDNDDVPMCKSSDFKIGYPNPDAPKAKSFPWQISGMDPNDFPADAEGNVRVGCDGCQLKEWGSHPASDSPYCSEQWTLPIYYDASGDGSGDWAPAIITLQKSSIKPIRTFLTQFAQSNNPPFISVGKGILKSFQRGTVTYSVPTFVKVGESDRDRWMEFSQQFGEMRDFLTRPPVREGGEGEQAPQAPASNGWGQQAPVQQAPVQQAPVQQAPVQQAPVQQAPVQQAPVQQAPVQQAPVQQAPLEDPWQQPAPAPAAGDPWGNQPVTQQPPAAPVAPQPPAAPVAPQPPAAPAAAPAPAAVSEDDLPF